MYCIDCCRASAAPLAPVAHKFDLFLSHKVLYRSNITRYYYHRFKYIPHEFAKHVYIASICCVIQFAARQIILGGT